MKRSVLAGVALVLPLLASQVLAGEVPLTTTRVASGLSVPLYVTSPPGDTGRLFIVEQGSGGSASIKILDLGTGTVLGTPYITITGLSTGGERGLLGLAFHPDYFTNGFFYVYVSDNAASNSVRRYTVTGNPLTSNVASTATMQNVLSMSDPFSNHNGGWIGFAPGGTPNLYVATGDGGSANDPNGAGQNVNNLLGKMLRLDVSGDAFPADPLKNYAIPAGNPFAGGGGAAEVWHWGLRNPFRDSFDRQTGEMYIGDVGQNAVEEISHAPAGVGGLNYGWRCMEGNSCTGLSGCTCNAASLTDPIRDYSHANGCTVIGGYVYRGTALGSGACGLQGTYFYADYCNSQIWSFRYVGGVVTNFMTRTTQLDPPGALSISSITSFGEDANGEIYITDHNGGEVFKIVEGPMVDCNGNGTQDTCDIANGTSQDVTGDGIPDECQPVVVSFCFGDGSLGNCPCGNNGFPSNGCDNSATTGGSLLVFSGSARTSNDTFVLMSTSELATAASIFLQGTTQVAAVPFGDGLRCTGGALKRLYLKNAVGGTATAPVGGDPSVSAQSANLGDTLFPGATRFYQTYYRDPNPTYCPDPPGSTFNISSGLRVTWAL